MRGSRSLKRPAAAVVAVGLSLSVGAIAATPAVSAAASAVPSSRVVTAAAPLPVGHTATFGHLKVRVIQVDRSSDSYFFGAKVKVCVTSLPAHTTSLRLSWDPWTIKAGTHTVQPGEFEEGQDPWAGHDAPVEGNYRVGQCMTGWVPFAVSGTAKVTKVSYANSLGNHASWKVSHGTSPQRKLGSTAKFKHFTVKVTKTKQDDAGFRAFVKTCVRSLPPGSSHGRTRLSWDPWVATAGTHFAFAPWVFDASHTFSPPYPQSGLYRAGQCVSGWVPFENVDPSLHIDRIAYRNSLGNQAFWTAAS